jgi:hypothetical protein
LLVKSTEKYFKFEIFRPPRAARSVNLGAQSATYDRSPQWRRTVTPQDGLALAAVRA